MLATGNLTLNHLLAHRAEQDGDKVGLIWESADRRWTELTYGELAERAGAVAGGLRRRGVGRGDHVVLHMANRLDFVVGLFAAARIGAVATPTIASYAVDELRYVLDHAGVKIVLCDSPRERAARDAAALAESAPDVVGPEDLATWCAEEVATPLDSEVAADDNAVLMYSSGTTARPKGVVLGHRALMTAGELNAQHMRLRPDDRLLCTLPLFHINALTISLLASMTTGSTCVVSETFSADRYWSQVRTFGITVGSLVANPIRQLLMLPERQKDAIHRLRCMMFGMPLSDTERAEFERRYRVPLINIWGMTEDGTIGTRSPMYLPRNTRSIGFAMPGTCLSLFDDEGMPVGPGLPGEARFRGVPRLTGYHRDEKLTEAATAEGWFRTGDTMTIDELGYFYFLDRTKDVIKVKAENVASAEVERVLTLHPAISDSAVVGLPDSWRDERIVAFVTLLPGSSITYDEIRAHCGLHLARFKVPHEVHVVAEFPRTSIGKVRKAELREQALRIAEPSTPRSPRPANGDHPR